MSRINTKFHNDSYNNDIVLRSSPWLSSARNTYLPGRRPPLGSAGGEPAVLWAEQEAMGAWEVLNKVDDACPCCSRPISTVLFLCAINTAGVRLQWPGGDSRPNEAQRLYCIVTSNISASL